MATSSSFLLFTRRIRQIVRFDLATIPRTQLPSTYSAHLSLSRASFSSLSHKQNYSSEITNNILRTNVNVPFDNLLLKRTKKTKSRGPKKEEESDDEEDDEDDTGEENPLLVEDPLEGNSDGCETTEVSVSTLRLDGFAKVAFATTRAKVEELFYKGDLYINGERPGKKSQDLTEGDEIDMVKFINPENHTLVDIKRVQILKLPDKTTEHGRFKVKINRWQNLTVKAYENK